MAAVWDLNNAVLAATVGATSMYLLKEALKSAGWTHIESCDGVNFSAAADQIGSIAEMGANGAWIALLAPGGVRSILIGHRTAGGDLSWYVAYSYAAGFAGGGAGAYPTAADSIDLKGTSAATAILFSASNSYIHIYADDVTDSFYCLVASQGAAQSNTLILGDELSDTVAGDSDGYVAGAVYGGGTDLFGTSYLYSITTGAKGWFDIGGGLASGVYVCPAIFYVAGNYLFPYGAGAGEGVNPHDDRAGVMPLIWGRTSASAAPYGYKGVSGSILKLCGKNVGAGDTLDLAGSTKDFVVYGGLKTALLWDNSTVPLV